MSTPKQKEARAVEAKAVKDRFMAEFEFLISVVAEMKEAMASRGITQREVAELMGVSQPQINRLLRIQGPISLGAINRFAIALNMRWEFNLIRNARPKKG